MTAIGYVALAFVVVFLILMFRFLAAITPQSGTIRPASPVPAPGRESEHSASRTTNERLPGTL